MWLGINIKPGNRIQDQNRQRRHEKKEESNTDRKPFLRGPLLPRSLSIVCLKADVLADVDNCRSGSNPVKFKGQRKEK